MKVDPYQIIHKGGLVQSESIKIIPSLYYVNATSIAKPNAKQHLTADIVGYDCEIVLIAESWLKDTHGDIEMGIEGYTLHRRDRVGKRKGGGLCAFVKDTINSRIINIADGVNINDQVEIMWLHCSHKNLQFCVCLCYFPPNPIHDVTQFVDQLSQSIDYVSDNIQNDFIVICGDFNNLRTDFLCVDYGLMQIVEQPTHGTNYLDKMFISRPDLYECLVCSSALKTKHKAIIARHSDTGKDVASNFRANTSSKLKVFDLRPHNIDHLRYSVGTFDWSFLFDLHDIDDMYSQFIDTVKCLINRCIPYKTVKIRKSEPYYITPRIKSMLNTRNRLRRSGKVQEADALAEKINSEITSLQARHLDGLSTANPKELWKAVHSCSGQKHSSGSYDELLNNPNHVNQFFANVSTSKNYDLSRINKFRSTETTSASGVASVFPRLEDYEIEMLLRRLKNTAPGIDDVPCWFFKNCSFEIAGAVGYIMRRTFETGTVPNNWLTAIVTPIPKIPNPRSLADFRPISVTPILSRLTEKVVVQRCLIPAISEPMLRDQFAYKKTGSTTCALTKILNYTTKALDNNKYVKCVFIDFSKAFDTVDHEKLIPKINRLDISPNIKNWIISFLTNRSQIVKINRLYSDKIRINMGIVQGSALGPTLFSIMASDLRPVSEHIELVKYADDMTLLIPEEYEEYFNIEILNLKSWAKENNLTINFVKTKGMNILRPYMLCRNDLNLEDIEFVSVFKLLGISVDSKINFSVHVSKILSQCNQRLYLLKLLKNQGMSIKSLHTVYQSLIVNRITYGISSWGGFLRQFDIDKINAMFRKGKKYGYTNSIFDFNGLLYFYDRNLFNNMLDSNHCLFHLLPEKTEHGKRTRHHDFQLPVCRNNNLYRQSFLPRALYSFI